MARRTLIDFFEDLSAHQRRVPRLSTTATGPGRTPIARPPTARAFAARLHAAGIVQGQHVVDLEREPARVDRRALGLPAAAASSSCRSTTAPRRTSCSASPASSTPGDPGRRRGRTLPSARDDGRSGSSSGRSGRQLTAAGARRRHLPRSRTTRRRRRRDHLHLRRDGRAEGRGDHPPQHPREHRPDRARDRRSTRSTRRPFLPIRFLNLLPLSHMFGQAMATFVPPMLPGVVVFTRSYAPEDIVRQIRDAARSRCWSACRRSSRCCAIT